MTLEVEPYLGAIDSKQLEIKIEVEAATKLSLTFLLLLVFFCIIWSDLWLLWTLSCGLPIIFFGSLGSYHTWKMGSELTALKEARTKHEEEMTRSCYNCKSNFYAGPKGHWNHCEVCNGICSSCDKKYIEVNRNGRQSHCEECKRICASCDTKHSEVNLNERWSRYCQNCKKRLEQRFKREKTKLFGRPQVQFNERNISDKEKQECWERLFGTSMGDDFEYSYICDSMIESDDYSMCSNEKLIESLWHPNEENDLEKFRKLGFKMEIDFYRTVNPRPMVVLRCKECAKHQELISEDSETTTDKRRSRNISEQVKDAVWRRDEGKCVQCGSNENLEFDHIIPHSKGGANTKRNVQLLCETCNRKKSDKIG